MRRGAVLCLNRSPRPTRSGRSIPSCEHAVDCRALPVTENADQTRQKACSACQPRENQDDYPGASPVSKQQLSAAWRDVVDAPQWGRGVGLSGCGMIRDKMQDGGNGARRRHPVVLGTTWAFVEHMAGGALIGRDGTSRNGEEVIPLGAESRHCRGFHVLRLAAPVSVLRRLEMVGRGARRARRRSAPLPVPRCSSLFPGRMLSLRRAREPVLILVVLANVWARGCWSDLVEVRSTDTSHYPSSRPLSVGIMLNQPESQGCEGYW